MHISTPTSSIRAALLGVLLVAGCASPEPPPPPEASRVTAYEPGVPGGVVVDTARVSARVVAIDRGRRTATLLGPEGREFTVKVGPEAVNFDQVEVGDVVNLIVTEELVIALGDAGAPQPDVEAALVALAPKGAQPGGLMANTVRISGTVVGIDPVAHTATLRFGDGSSRTFPVRSDIDLSSRKLGEQVVFQVTEMVALDVEKP